MIISAIKRVTIGRELPIVGKIGVRQLRRSQTSRLSRTPNFVLNSARTSSRRSLKDMPRNVSNYCAIDDQAVFSPSITSGRTVRSSVFRIFKMWSRVNRATELFVNAWTWKICAR